MTEAGGSGDFVVMVNAGFTVSENLPLFVPPAPSVTVTVKLSGPTVVGIPESSPVVLMLSPVPVSPVAVQANGDTPVPVDTANCCEYELPASAAGSVVGVPIVTAGAIVPVNGWLAVRAGGPLLSVTPTLYW